MSGSCWTMLYQLLKIVYDAHSVMRLLLDLSCSCWLSIVAAVECCLVYAALRLRLPMRIVFVFSIKFDVKNIEFNTEHKTIAPWLTYSLESYLEQRNSIASNGFDYLLKSCLTFILSNSVTYKLQVQLKITFFSYLLLIGVWRALYHICSQLCETLCLILRCILCLHG